MFMFPNSNMISWMNKNGVMYFLTGFENDQPDGRGLYFNFVFSNGERSSLKDKNLNFFTHMMPKGKRIKSVDFYNQYGYITGFQFYDEEGKFFWHIGKTCSWSNLEKSTIMLADNELIVGVSAKLMKPKHFKSSVYSHL